MPDTLTNLTIEEIINNPAMIDAVLFPEPAERFDYYGALDDILYPKRGVEQIQWRGMQSRPIQWIDYLMFLGSPSIYSPATHYPEFRNILEKAAAYEKFPWASIIQDYLNVRAGRPSLIHKWYDYPYDETVEGPIYPDFSKLNIAFMRAFPERIRWVPGEGRITTMTPEEVIQAIQTPWSEPATQEKAAREWKLRWFTEGSESLLKDIPEGYLREAAKAVRNPPDWAEYYYLPHWPAAGGWERKVTKQDILKQLRPYIPVEFLLKSPPERIPLEEYLYYKTGKKYIIPVSPFEPIVYDVNVKTGEIIPTKLFEPAEMTPELAKEIGMTPEEWQNLKKKLFQPKVTEKLTPTEIVSKPLYTPPPVREKVPKGPVLTQPPGIRRNIPIGAGLPAPGEVSSLSLGSAILGTPLQYTGGYYPLSLSEVIGGG